MFLSFYYDIGLCMNVISLPEMVGQLLLFLLSVEILEKLQLTSDGVNSSRVIGADR